ncbi:DUF6020 family protein [Bacillus sp. V59.32b]|uniref:DUF6020 family protein n=1 Tax=Bacillus sp. V59.32b TaxID=1758642 RepID=UPI000E3E908C|nr:DUF6020 family protein [Bacillus sp. V59.32b]RFU66839.1 hypothetical protein D0463_08855 [Bacillus sp. V59.32b]
MKYRNIIIVALFSVIGIVCTNFYYVDSLTLNWPIALFIFFFFLLLLRNWANLCFSWINITASLILAIFWLYSSYNGQSHLTNDTLQLIILITSTLIISFFFYLLISELQQPFQKEVTKPNFFWFTIYTLIPIISWSRYFLAYYPGKMTNDSFWQWSMAHGVKPYHSWHPILHTWWIEATTWIYNSPATFIISQIIVVALIVGYSLYILQSLGTPKILVITLSLLYAFYPINGYYMVTMWKDIPFAAFILLITAIFTLIVRTNGKWLDKKSNIVLLILASFITMNLRNNGFLALLAAFVILIIFMKAIRKKTIFTLISILVIHFIFNGVIAKSFHVIENPLNQALAIPSQQIGATYKFNGQFTPELKSYFNQILPEENWKKKYNPYIVNPIKHDPLYNPKVIDEDFGRYLKNWAKLLQLNFDIYVKAYLDQTSVLWRFYSPEGYKVYVNSTTDIEDYPLKTRVLFSETSLNKFYYNPKESVIENGYTLYKSEAEGNLPAKDILSYSEYKKSVSKSLINLKSESKQENWKKEFDQSFYNLINYKMNYFAKGAIPMVLLLLAVVSSCIRNGKKGLIVFAPALFLLLTVAIALPATDFRYTFSFIFSIPFLILYGKTREINNFERDA